MLLKLCKIAEDECIFFRDALYTLRDNNVLNIFLYANIYSILRENKFNKQSICCSQKLVIYLHLIINILSIPAFSLLYHFSVKPRFIYFISQTYCTRVVYLSKEHTIYNHTFFLQL